MSIRTYVKAGFMGLVTNSREWEGATKGGRASKVLPEQKGGVGKSFSHAKRFGVVFTQ